MHASLPEVPRERSSLHLAYNVIVPSGWDAPAFCANLFEAISFDDLRQSRCCKIALTRLFMNGKLMRRNPLCRKWPAPVSVSGLL